MMKVIKCFTCFIYRKNWKYRKRLRRIN